VQRHLHVQFGVGIHALEVDVQNLLLERVNLHVAQQHVAFGSAHFHGQNAGMKGFFFQRVPQCVVVHLDQLGFSGTTIKDARCATGDAQTAARTRTVLGTLKSDKFH